MKKTTSKKSNRVSSRRVSGAVKASNIAKSFVNIGIPVVMETQIGVDYRGMSSQLIQSGNKPVRSYNRQLKIKL